MPRDSILSKNIRNRNRKKIKMKKKLRKALLTKHKKTKKDIPSEVDIDTVPSYKSLETNRIFKSYKKFYKLPKLDSIRKINKTSEYKKLKSFFFQQKNKQIQYKQTWNKCKSFFNKKRTHSFNPINKEIYRKKLKNYTSNINKIFYRKKLKNITGLLKKKGKWFSSKKIQKNIKVSKFLKNKINLVYTTYNKNKNVVKNTVTYKNQRYRSSSNKSNCDKNIYIFNQKPFYPKKSIKSANGLHSSQSVPQGLLRILTEKFINNTHVGGNYIKTPFNIIKPRLSTLSKNKPISWVGLKKKNSTKNPKTSNKLNFTTNYMKLIKNLILKKKHKYRVVTPVCIKEVDNNQSQLHVNSSDISLGLKKTALATMSHIDIKNPQLNVIQSLRNLFLTFGSKFKRNFNQNNFVFTMFLLVVFMDVSILTSYINKLFYRTPFFKQRRLFYLIRKLIKPTSKICSTHSNLMGMYIGFRGKIATKAGLRKKILTAKSGVYSSANFGIQHKYKFKQIWSHSGAIGLKTIITVGPHHKNNFYKNKNL